MASERRIYRAIDPISKAEAESAAKRNDADELLRVVIAVGLLNDPDDWVRGQADSAADDLAWYAKRSVRDTGRSVDSDVGES